MGDHRALAEGVDQILRTRAFAGQHLVGPIGVDSEAPVLGLGEQRLGGLLRRPDRDPHLARMRQTPVQLWQADALESRGQGLFGHRCGRGGVG